MRRFAILAALLLIAFVLAPRAASARVLLPVADESGGSATLQSSIPTIVADGPNVRLTWSTDNNQSFLSRFSTDGGESFGPAEDSTNYWKSYYAGNSSLNSATKQVGDRLYQAWAVFQGGGTFYRYSTDLGVTWSDPVTLTTQSFVQEPQVSAFGDRVFVTWDDNGELFGASSFNKGVTLSDPVDLGLNFGYQMTALANGGVTIARSSFTTDIITVDTFPTGDFTESPTTSLVKVGGKGFSPTTSITLTPTGDVILVWTWAANFDPATKETIRFAASTDNALTFATPVILANANANFENPIVAASNSGWYFVWSDRTSETNRTLYEQSFYDSGLTDAGRVTLDEHDFLSIPFVNAIGDSGFVGWNPTSADNTIKLATLRRNTAPEIYTVPTGLGFNAQAVVSTSGSDTSLDIAWFGALPTDPNRRLLYSRAVITGSSDCTGNITAADIVAALRAATNLPPATPCAGATDVNCDGAITPADALLLADNVAGVSASPVAGCSPIAS